MNQKGFASLVILIGIVLVSSLGAVIFLKGNYHLPMATKSENQATTSANLNTPTPTPSSSPSAYPKNSQTSSKTPTPTPKPTSSPTPTPSTNTTVSNPYDLTSATGSVKVMIKPQSGNLAYTPSAELSTVSGFKVLDGRSTDKITQSGRSGPEELREEIIFSTAPPGPYKVRISYNGSWSDQKDVTVSSAQQTYVEFSVAGVAPTPTPTPRPKPICSVLIMPSSSGTAPYDANICVSNDSNPFQAVQQQFIDYDGNGSWDFQSSNFGCQSHTFQSPGTFSVKAKILGSSGDESDVCQTTATVN